MLIFTKIREISALCCSEKSRLESLERWESLAMVDSNEHLSSANLVSRLGWQPLPEITKMAAITHRVNKQTCNKN